MPLEHLLAVIRDPNESEDRRMYAAVAAAPYFHCKLNVIEHSGPEEKPVGYAVTLDVPLISQPLETPYLTADGELRWGQLRWRRIRHCRQRLNLTRETAIGLPISPQPRDGGSSPRC